MTNKFSLSSEEMLRLEAVWGVTDSGSGQLDIDKCSKKAAERRYICERVVDAGRRWALTGIGRWWSGNMIF